MADNRAKTVILNSRDHIEFVVSEAVAMKMKVVGYMIEDDYAQTAIPLYNVKSNILTKVIEYYTKHVSVPEEAAEEHKTWDAEFINVDLDTLYDLLMAANYLDIPDLLDLACEKAADIMVGKQPEELRQIFNITNAFSPEEEEEYRRNYSWAFPEYRRNYVQMGVPIIP